MKPQPAKAVGLFEAKTHLSALIEQVAQGREITITRRGVPVARLMPADGRARRSPRAAVDRIRELRRRLKLGRVPIRQLIEAGRL